MDEKIKEALARLDVTNDAHWTADGLPKLETVRFFAGNQSISREDVSKAAPGFSRATAAATAANGAQAPQAGASDTAAKQPDSAAPAAPAPGAADDAGALSIGEGANGEVHTEGTAREAGSDAEEEANALEEELAAAQAELAQVEQAFVHAEKYRAEVRAEIDRLTAALEKVRPAPTTADAIRGYLASQAQQLEQRAKLKEQLAQNGAGVQAVLEMVKGAPIDAAMSRKTGRGTARPMYNPGGKQ